ncbi:MAG: hypothetical protein KGL39_09635 [Patescibacteria group bacterium]|nr:hypothetical protein [Patescibacteria group bacterium]
MSICAAQKAWRKTPRGQYNKQKWRAQQRRVPFLLSFEQWWRIWQESGHYEERGAHRGGYNMHRYNDTGAYEDGNVFIGTHEHNSSSRHAAGRAETPIVVRWEDDEYLGYHRVIENAISAPF